MNELMRIPGKSHSDSGVCIEQTLLKLFLSLLQVFSD